MASLVRCIIFSLFIALCVCDFGTQVQKVCLYSKGSSTVMTPLKLVNSNCAANTSYCMNRVYNYNNFQYGGPAGLKPVKGEVVMFLTQDQQNRFDYVCLLNANVTTTMNVSMDITGCEPTDLLLKDDPEKDGDAWGWNSTTNSGKFRWVTQPTYTDGVIIGHLSFIDGYCVKTVFNQPNKAISQISVMTGNITNPVKILTVPYVPGSTFEFCQYPLTASYHSDVSCPNAKDGSASIDLIFGPPSVSYKWTNSSGSVIGTSRNLTGLAAGDYQVEVNDLSNSGCQAIKVITVGAPTLGIPVVATVAFGCTVLGSASVTPVGGKGPFTYAWSGGAITGSISASTSISIPNLLMGTYTVTVTDSCGSSAQASFTIGTIGCCGDGICQASEACGSAGSCTDDCGTCCVPGTYKTGSSCTVCPPGKRSTTYNAASCTDCAANTFNAGGAEQCLECPANTYSAAGSGKCLDCAYGTVRASNQASCQPCASGYFAEPCGDGCTKAAAGTEASESWAQVSCPPGTYAAAGSAACSPCPAGQYSASKATTCSQCPSGTTTVGVGATHVLSCF